MPVVELTAADRRLPDDVLGAALVRWRTHWEQLSARSPDPLPLVLDQLPPTLVPEMAWLHELYGADGSPPDPLDRPSGAAPIDWIFEADLENAHEVLAELHVLVTYDGEMTLVKGADGVESPRPLQRGGWKTTANVVPNMLDAAVWTSSVEDVGRNLDDLVVRHLAHVRDGVAPEVQAAWLHHEFIRIHPFADGNGRVARLLASLVFVRVGGLPLPRPTDRDAYYAALRAAHAGDLGPLTRHFAAAQLEILNAALQVPDESGES